MSKNKKNVVMIETDTLRITDLDNHKIEFCGYLCDGNMRIIPEYDVTLLSFEQQKKLRDFLNQIIEIHSDPKLKYKVKGKR